MAKRRSLRISPLLSKQLRELVEQIELTYGLAVNAETLAKETSPSRRRKKVGSTKD